MTNYVVTIRYEAPDFNERLDELTVEGSSRREVGGLMSHILEDEVEVLDISEA